MGGWSRAEVEKVCSHTGHLGRLIRCALPSGTRGYGWKVNRWQLGTFTGVSRDGQPRKLTAL